MNAPSERIRLPWHDWLESESTSDLGGEAATEGAAKVVLQMLHRGASTSVDWPAIDIFHDPMLKRPVVVSTAFAAKHSIELAPCVPKTQKLRTDCIHPDRVLIGVEERVGGVADGPTFEFYVQPEWQAPEEATISHAVACEHRRWAWSGKESMHPHWAVRRLTEEQLAKTLPRAIFSTEQRVKELSVVGVCGTYSRMYMVRVPFLTNSIDLQRGVELL